MNTFIKKQEFNYINKSLFDLNNTFRNCTDPSIVEATKACIQQKILSIFTDLSEEEKTLLDIAKITDPLHIDGYLKELDQYVYEMPNVTNSKLSKAFKKEKKLKFPSSDAQYSKLVYLGWIDESTRKLLTAYNLDGKLLGMACRLPNDNFNNICTLCNHVGSESEIAFFSPICKVKSQDDYKFIGFHACLNSAECNERITSVEKLEELLREVNRIK